MNFKPVPVQKKIEAVFRVAAEKKRPPVAGKVELSYTSGRKGY